MGLLGFILPPLLVFGGLTSLWWLSTPLEAQNSLSAYYHASGISESIGLDCTANDGVYRDLFVGILAVTGACSILYGGFNSLENWLLNLAGVFLLGVAFFPTDWPEQQFIDACSNLDGFQRFQASQLLGLPISIHGASAILFFLAITAVNFFTALKTVELIEDGSQRRFWARIFQWARWLMPAAPVVVLLVKLLTGDSLIEDDIVLWVEWVGIWAFSIYWILKSIEIFRSTVQIDLLRRK